MVMVPLMVMTWVAISAQPLDFIARRVALTLMPGINLTRLHRVVASNSRHRALVPLTGTE